MFLDATESWTFTLEDLHDCLACSAKSDWFWCRWMSWNVVKVVSFHTRLYDIQNGQKWPRPLLKLYSSLAGHLIEILYWKYFLRKFVCSRTTICREMSWKLTEMLLGQLDRCKLTLRPPNTLTSRQWALQGPVWLLWRSLTKDFHGNDKVEKKLQQSEVGSPPLLDTLGIPIGVCRVM